LKKAIESRGVVAGGRSARATGGVLVASLVLAVAAGCGGSEGSSSGADTTDGAGSAGVDAMPDDASQALQTAALDYLAPAGGESTHSLMLVSVWAIEELNRACGVEGSMFMDPEDRYDQVRFPDFERIEEHGIGLIEAREAEQREATEAGGAPPTPSSPPASAGDPECIATAIPALTEGQTLRGAWMRDVVEATLATSDAQDRASAATDCLREEMSVSASELPNLDSFFAMLDGRATHLIGLPAEDAQREYIALDESATAAFLTCTPDFYGWFNEQLTSARPDFVDRHREAIEGFTAEMDARGYTP
jgi:hypothetical protein